MITERKVRFYDNYYGAVNKIVSNKTVKFYEEFVNISRFTVMNGNTLGKFIVTSRQYVLKQVF